ncbi:MAG: HAMP domain-containing methyl-accepting chemotaxis protein, partial [Alphaproteobacteria bacterium]
AWNIGGATPKPIAQATDGVEKLAAGDDNVEIAATARKDEIGRLWRAMAALKATVTEAFRLKTMVDEMPINVMTCDTRNDFKIDYANKTTKTNIKALEKLLPIRAEDLIGTSIDVFHKNPEHQRRILSNPSNLPYNATIRLGEEALELKVSAIRDGKGDYIGPMLTWTIVTEQLKLAGNVKEVVGLVASASTEMRSTAESMSATAEETGRQATSVAAASEQASANVQTVASAAEQLSASIAEISWQVAQSTKIAQEAVVQAGTANERIKGLADASQRIGEVVGVISDIASQTNLLALNATIEAARAGEAGKGFAVIASEVKSLATQTAKATEEIAAQIGTIQTAIGESVSVIKAIGGTIAEVNQIAATIATAVEQQGAATNEISRNVQEASRGTAEVSSNVAGVNQAASETGQAASQVLLAASELATQANKLGGEVEKFMARIGAAA